MSMITPKPIPNLNALNAHCGFLFWLVLNETIVKLSEKKGFPWKFVFC